MASGRVLTREDAFRSRGPVIGATLWALAAFAQLDPAFHDEAPRRKVTREDVGQVAWARRSVEVLTVIAEDPWGLYDPLDPDSVKRHWRTIAVLTANARMAEGDSL